MSYLLFPKCHVYKNTWLYKNGTKICSQESLDLARSINENHIALEQHKIQELCLREFSHREKYINSKVLGNPYPKYTNQTIYRRTDESFLFFFSRKGDDWKSFGYKRKIELLRIEGSVFFHQLRKLDLNHTWKEIYINVNIFCDSHEIPYKNREKCTSMKLKWFLYTYMIVCLTITLKREFGLAMQVYPSTTISFHTKETHTYVENN